MISRKQQINLQLNQLVDAVLLGATLWISYWLRDYGLVDFDLFPDIPPFEHHLWMLAVIMPFGPFLLELHGFYNYPLEKSALRSLRQILQAGMWLVLLIGLCVIFLRLAVPSRSVLSLFAVLAPVVLLLRERVVAWVLLGKLRHGEMRESIILAGEARRMDQLLAGFSQTQKLEVNVVQKINLQQKSISDLVAAIHRHGVGRVILCFASMKIDTVQKAIEACEVEGVEAWLSADFIRTSVAKPTYEVLSGRPMLVFRATPDISWALVLKGTMDRVGAAIGLLLLSPLLLLVAALIRMTSPGPAVFRQQRAGIHGKPFTMLKFRSMVSDAESRRAALSEHNEMSGPVFKVENDPRVTPLGRFLRKTSIDELPQLINVLRGEMSLVGPRPLPVYEVRQFEKAEHRRRLSMKPGLTCLWQVRGRNKVTNFNDWVKMDLEYIDNWSIWLDVAILLRTIPAVVMGMGAK